MQLDLSHNQTNSQPLHLPLPTGCGLSAMKEVSFAWNGFTNAMLSNVGMVLRNIYSKKALGDYKDADVSVESCTTAPASSTDAASLSELGG